MSVRYDIRPGLNINLWKLNTTKLKPVESRFLLSYENGSRVVPRLKCYHKPHGGDGGGGLPGQKGFSSAAGKWIGDDMF